MPDTPMTVDRAHYVLIVSNSRDLKYLCRELAALREDVADLRERKCPCDAVGTLSEKVNDLELANAREATKVAGIISSIGMALNLVVMYLAGRP